MHLRYSLLANASDFIISPFSGVSFLVLSVGVVSFSRFGLSPI